jgi:hypothetical protein
MKYLFKKSLTLTETYATKINLARVLFPNLRIHESLMRNIKEILRR